MEMFTLFIFSWFVIFKLFPINHSHFKLFGTLCIIVFILAFFIKAILYIIHKLLHPFFIIYIFFYKLLAFLVLCTKVFDVWLHFLLQELAAFDLLVEVLYFSVLLLDYRLFRCHLRLDLKINKRVKNFRNVGTHLVERLALFLDFVLKHLLLRLQIHLQLLDGVLLDLLHFDVVHGHAAARRPVTLVPCVDGGVHRRLDHLVDPALHETVVLVPDVDVARVVPIRFLQGFLQPLLHHFLDGLVLLQGQQRLFPRRHARRCYENDQIPDSTQQGHNMALDQHDHHTRIIYAYPNASLYNDTGNLKQKEGLLIMKIPQKIHDSGPFDSEKLLEDLLFFDRDFASLQSKHLFGHSYRRLQSPK